MLVSETTLDPSCVERFVRASAKLAAGQPPDDRVLHASRSQCYAIEPLRCQSHCNEEKNGYQRKLTQCRLSLQRRSTFAKTRPWGSVPYNGRLASKWLIGKSIP